MLTAANAHNGRSFSWGAPGAARAVPDRATVNAIINDTTANIMMRLILSAISSSSFSRYGDPLWVAPSTRRTTTLPHRRHLVKLPNSPWGGTYLLPLFTGLPRALILGN